MNARTKLFSILGLSLAFVGAAAFAGDKDAKDTAKGAKIGEKAPAWTAKDLTGKEWKSTDFANKIVVLDWVNPGCPICKGAHKDGRIPNMVKELKGMDGVVFIAVNSTFDPAANSAESNTKALKDYGVEYPILLDNDGKLGKMFGAKTTPHVFVIDQTGVLRYQGALDNNAKGDKSGADLTNYALNAVKQIKAGETVSPDSTKSYGCSVKYAKKETEGDHKH